MNIEKSTLVVLPVNILFLTMQILIGVFVMLKSNQRKELKADFVKYISLHILRWCKKWI